MEESNFKKIFPLDALKEILEKLEEDFKRYGETELLPEYSQEVSKCYSCGSSSSSSVTLFKKGPFSYFQCSDCELVYVNPRLCDEETNKLYQEGRCFYQMQNFYLPGAKARKEKIYKRKLESIQQQVGVGSILDFGSSTGYFLQTAVESGWDAHGVELNPFAVKWAREKLNLKNVHNQYLAECDFSPAQFDAITMWDVLEHIPDPVPILSDLKKLLKPDGIFVVETSHYDCLETELLGADNTNVVGDMHIMHFTEKSLRTMLSEAGFTVNEIEIFGLDISHIIAYQSVKGGSEVKLPESYIGPLQRCVDEAGKGCYIKAVCRG